MVQQARYCQSCGAEISQDAAFCAKCGQAVASAQQPQQQQPAPPYTAPAPQGKSSGGTAACCILGAIVGVVLLVIVAVMAVAYFIYFRTTTPSATSATPPTTTTPPTTVEAEDTGAIVPDVVGLDPTSAEDALIDSGDFVVAYNDARYSDDYAEGTIIAQHPKPGTNANRGDTVYIVRSKGSAPAPPAPSIADAEALVQKFLVAIQLADAATARSCIVPGSEPFDLDLLGQGDFDHMGFDRVEYTKHSSTHLVFKAREIMEDWETGDYFYDDWGIVMTHNGSRWQITRFDAG